MQWTQYSRRRRICLWIGCGVWTAGLCLTVVAAEPRPAEWPAYRRDAGLTGRSPLNGGLAAAPSVRWKYDLGGASVASEQTQLFDVNGDGRDDVIRVLSDRIICQSVSGDVLWETQRFAKPHIVHVRDFAGDGTRGLLVASSTGVAHHRHMVSGLTGKATLLYTCKNVFGRYERVGRILPDVAGEQLCAWWSGDTEKRFGSDAALGVGYLWSFEDGVDNPQQRFHAEEEGTIYAPLHLFADMDGDGDDDMVMISHEAMWVYDLESGETLVDEFYWGPRIRTYWAATAAMPLRKGELPSLLMINPMIPGVQVVTQDAKTATSKWKRVVGDDENQYQAAVKIDRAAPDPFVDLDGDGDIEIMAAVTNEHGDDKVHLVIFKADDGARLYDAADQSVLTVDDLDGVAPPEVLIKESHNALRICNWNGETFVDRWRANYVTPLIESAPAEGHLARAVGARSSSVNMPLWRDEANGELFLLRFADSVWSCRLTSDSVEQVAKVAAHPAFTPPPPPTEYYWDGSRVHYKKEGETRVTYEVPRRQSYAANPPLVGMLGDELRIVAREFSGAIVSLAADGSDRVVLIDEAPSSLGTCIADLDGDGANDVLSPRQADDGSVVVVAVDSQGKELWRVSAPPDTTETKLGPTGRLGSGGGRWFVVRYQIAYQNARVVAYDGASREQLWMRDYLGPERVPSTKFMLHLPAAVHDIDGDGADDLIASSENWYETISVKDNRTLTPNETITAAVPGHWGAYATPLVADVLGNGEPLVFHNNAYALNLLTKLDGSPVWHYGVTRDTTHASLSGLADLEGDRTIEVITTQQDGLLRAFDAEPTPHKCPTCQPNEQLTAANHGGKLRWTFQLAPPVSDITTLDIDADGRDELLCGSGTRLVALEDNAGACSVVWEVDLGATVGSPIVTDLDGDGTPEVLVTTSNGRLHLLSP